MKSVSLSPKLKLVLRVVYKAKGLKTATQTWMDFRRELEALRVAQNLEAYRIGNKMSLDGFDLSTIRSEPLPSKKSYDRYLIILSTKKLVVLHKEGDSQQSHTYPVITKAALELLENKNYFHEFFAVEVD